MPTISPSLVLQLCLPHSSKQKVSGFMCKLGHLINKRSETWIFFSLKSTRSWTAPLQRHLDAKIFRLKSFSLCTILSLSHLTVGLERVTCLALGPWSEAELGPGLYHLSRWLLCSKIPSHMSYMHPSDSSLCQLGSGNESLRSPCLKGKLVSTTLRSSRHVLSLATWYFHSRHCTCLHEILRTLSIPVPTAEYFRWTHRRNTFSVSTTCIFNSALEASAVRFPRTNRTKRKKRLLFFHIKMKKFSQFLTWQKHSTVGRGKPFSLEKNMQASPLPHCMSGRENRNREILFYIA